jgi:hypothetical protein
VCSGWTRDATVLVRRENDKILVREQVGGGEAPFRQVPGRIGQIPPIQIDGVRARVIDLDPVLLVTIFIDEAAVIFGEELGDDDVVLGGQKLHARQAE